MKTYSRHYKFRIHPTSHYCFICKLWPRVWTVSLAVACSVRWWRDKRKREVRKTHKRVVGSTAWENCGLTVVLHPRLLCTHMTSMFFWYSLNSSAYIPKSYTDSRLSFEFCLQRRFCGVSTKVLKLQSVFVCVFFSFYMNLLCFFIHISATSRWD